MINAYKPLIKKIVLVNEKLDKKNKGIVRIFDVKVEGG